MCAKRSRIVMLFEMLTSFNLNQGKYLTIGSSHFNNPSSTSDAIEAEANPFVTEPI